MVIDPKTLPKIWFLRHGETYWNAERRIQGQLESDLTPKGRDQAQAQAKIIKPILALRPACFVSPLGRAQQTAQIALGQTAFQTDARLAEAHAGEWQGMLRDEVRRDFPDIVAPDVSALEMFVAAPGGESFEVFQARIVDFMRDLTAPSVVVAHGLLGQVMRGLILGRSRPEMSDLANEQACVYLLDQGTETVLR